MSVTVILGAQWGDEGKGKIASMMSQQGLYGVARFQGGPNAGHTIRINGQPHVFRLLPCGFLHARECYLGNGMVINLDLLDQELQFAKQSGYNLNSIWISNRAHIILPKHTQHEGDEHHRIIGTTNTGVGPSYTDKVHRSGVRMEDVLHQSSHFLRQSAIFKRVALKFIHKYHDRITDIADKINTSLSQGKSILAEGAQGALLDIDHGHYPFVTSSNTTVGAVCTGLGISPKHIEKVILVASAYQTKVGGGPFPTQFDQTSPFVKWLQQKGHEVDPVTKQLRQCGWLDLVLLREAVKINHPNSLVLTKVDVLSGIHTLKVGVGYTLLGEKCHTPPVLADQLAEVIPIYQECPVWSKNISKLRRSSQLPKEVHEYIKIIEAFVKCKISGISVGPNDGDYIHI
jgi:adenylosuccinate synthase